MQGIKGAGVQPHDRGGAALRAVSECVLVELAPFKVHRCVFTVCARSAGLGFGAAARWMDAQGGKGAYKHLADQDDDRR